jgi:hypothetical protein
MLNRKKQVLALVIIEDLGFLPLVGKIDIWIFFRSTKTTICITTAVVEADSIDYTRPIWLADNAM